MSTKLPPWTHRPDGQQPSRRSRPATGLAARTASHRLVTAGGRRLLDSLLDAAEAVVVRQGIANLTLDAVAAESGPEARAARCLISPPRTSPHWAMADRCR
jgi:hypothetical protein